MIQILGVYLSECVKIEGKKVKETETLFLTRLE